MTPAVPHQQGSACSCPLGASASARPEQQRAGTTGKPGVGAGSGAGTGAGAPTGLGLGGALGLPAAAALAPLAGLLSLQPNLQSAEALQQAYQQVALVYSQYLAVLSSSAQQQQQSLLQSSTAASAASAAGSLPALAALSTALAQNPALAIGHLAHLAPSFASASPTAASLDGEPDHKRVKMCRS